MDARFLRRLAVSLRHVGFPLLVFLICLQAFQIVLMSVIN